MKSLVRRWHAHTLGSDDVAKRLRGIEKLADSRDPEAVNLLIAMLADTEAEVRETAAAALGMLGDERAVKPLENLVLSERASRVAAQATSALARLIGPHVAIGLVSALSDADVVTRQAAACALRSVGWEQLDEATRARVVIVQDNWAEATEIGFAAIEPLKSAMCAGTRHTSRLAAEAIGNIGTQDALVALLSVLKESDAGRAVQETAAWGIRRICWENVNDTDLATAGTLLGEWSNVAAIGNAAVGPLVTALSDDDAGVRQAVVQTLSTIGTDDAIAALNQTVCDATQDVSVRQLAATLLAHRNDPQSERALVMALTDTAWSVRVAAATALDKRAWHPTQAVERTRLAIARKDLSGIDAIGCEAIEPLVDALQFHAVGTEAAHALAALGKPGRDALVAVLQRDGDNTALREVAATALAACKDPRALEPVRDMLRDRDMAVRQAAVWALERLGWEPSNGTEQAVAAIAHDDWDRIRKLGVSAIEPLLQLAVDAPAPQEAADALEQLLDSCAGRVSIDHLRKVVGIENAGPVAGHPHRQAEGNDAGVERVVDFARIRRLATAELQRRGIMS